MPNYSNGRMLGEIPGSAASINLQAAQIAESAAEKWKVFTAIVVTGTVLFAIAWDIKRKKY